MDFYFIIDVLPLHRFHPALPYFFLFFFLKFLKKVKYRLSKKYFPANNKDLNNF